MADEDQDPMAAMMPPADNPEYHRKKAEHEERLSSEAGNAALTQHGYIAERVQRVRRNPPKAAAPAPPPRPEHQEPPPEVGTGLQVDPRLSTRFPQDEAPPPLPEPEPVVSPAPAPAPQPPAAPQQEPTAGTTHPLLQKLRRDFGIETIPLEEVPIGGHVFTMRVLDANAVTSAVRFADMLSVSPRENELNLQTCLASFAVVAIDDEPLWRVFEVPLEEAERVQVEGAWKPVFDPTNPPERVRMMGSTQFMDFLSKEATTDLLSALWKAYKEKVDPKGSLEVLLGEAEMEGGSQDLPLP